MKRIVFCFLICCHSSLLFSSSEGAVSEKAQSEAPIASLNHGDGSFFPLLVEKGKTNSKTQCQPQQMEGIQTKERSIYTYKGDGIENQSLLENPLTVKHADHFKYCSFLLLIF